jgi:hypothetical protein
MSVDPDGACAPLGVVSNAFRISPSAIAKWLTRMRSQWKLRLRRFYFADAEPERLKKEPQGCRVCQQGGSKHAMRVADGEVERVKDAAQRCYDPAAESRGAGQRTGFTGEGAPPAARQYWGSNTRRYIANSFGSSPDRPPGIFSTMRSAGERCSGAPE